MTKLMKWLMLSCRKSTELMEKESFAGLKALEKIQLFLHTSMCDACTSYYKQSHFIDNAAKHQNTDVKKQLLSEKVKREIISKLEQQ